MQVDLIAVPNSFLSNMPNDTCRIFVLTLLLSILVFLFPVDLDFLLFFTIIKYFSNLKHTVHNVGMNSIVRCCHRTLINNKFI